jgi:hypothetical protein
MTNIRQLFRALMLLFKAPRDSKNIQRLPAALEAEHLQLLLSCGF